eukprot:8467973-Pyramimonas_sp.AAC.1
MFLGLAIGRLLFAPYVFCKRIRVLPDKCACERRMAQREGGLFSSQRTVLIVRGLFGLSEDWFDCPRTGLDCPRT